MFALPHHWADRPVKVVLAGAGGTGSEVLDGLARIDRALRALGHPGLEVAVYDPDTVSATNTIRQRFWPADVGANKAQLLMHRYGTFGGLAGAGYPRALTAAGLAEAHSCCDLVVTCVDRAAVRAEIGIYAWSDGWAQEAMWLDFGNGARTGQVVLGHLSGWQDDPRRLPNVVDLFPELREPASLDADDAPSCSAQDALAAQDLMVNRWVAVAGCDLLWTLFRRGKIEAHGFFLRERGARVTELAIDPQVWAGFGLVCPDRAA